MENSGRKYTRSVSGGRGVLGSNACYPQIRKEVRCVVGPAGNARDRVPSLRRLVLRRQREDPPFLPVRLQRLRLPVLPPANRLSVQHALRDDGYPPRHEHRGLRGGARRARGAAGVRDDRR